MRGRGAVRQLAASRSRGRRVPITRGTYASEGSPASKVVLGGSVYVVAYDGFKV